jgi:hypothetical protein
MAEDTLTGRVNAGGGDSTAGATVAAIVRYRAAIISLLIAVLCFCIYWFLGTQHTFQDNFVRLADTFLQGRVDMENGPQLEEFIELAYNDGKYYIIPPPWPAFLVLPLVAVWGLAVNQALVSAVLGAIGSSTAFNVTRSMSRRLSTQLWLTVLMAFGTVYWFAAANGAVWFFSHTVAVLFLLLAIYFTMGRRNALLAGLCLGAAFWTRQPTILTLPFFLIMFSDDWLQWDSTKPLIQRINSRPLILLGAGLGVFMLASFVYNYIRWGTPLDASQHHLPPRVLAQPWFDHGPFDIRYISRHVETVFEFTPLVRSEKPYVLSNLWGSAIWITTPAFLYALFAKWKNDNAILIGAMILLFGMALVVSRAVSGLWDSRWYSYDFPAQLNLLPFYAVIAMALWFGRRDKFIVACWAAILPTALMLSTFAGTGWAQFGYRFQLDFMPFLFLLTTYAMGPDLKWHHKSMIVLSVLLNAWAIAWMYHFEPNATFGITEWSNYCPYPPCP